jgi:hypothetical protein
VAGALAASPAQSLAQNPAGEIGAPKDRGAPKDNGARDGRGTKDTGTTGAGTKDTGAKDTGTKESGAKPSESAQKSRLVSILGREVVNREGDSGRVIDVLVDLDGGPGAVVVEFGGFMGIGSRKVAVDWSTLHLLHDGQNTKCIVDVSRGQIRDSPEYKPNEPPTVLTTK